VIVITRPNPFTDLTTLEYELDQPGQVTIFIFNSQGQQVEVLVNNYQDKGQYMVQWNAEGLPAGVYFYKLTVGSRQSAVGKILKY
jgi:serine protease AprX